MRHNFINEIDVFPTEAAESVFSSRIITYMDFWLANLHTVVYGYKEAKLNNAYINNLIDINATGLIDLKNYRDSTFHFEDQDFRNKKMTKMKDLNMLWVDNLHNFLGDYLLMGVKQAVWDGSQKNKIINDISQKKINKLRIRDPLKENNTSELAIYRLGQYWLRARLMHAHFKRALKKSDDANLVEQTIYLGSWYTSLICVIEGYLKLNLSNDKIDQLLNSHHYESLKGFRHAFTGYHKDYYNLFLINQLLADKDSVKWVNEIHYAFHTYLQEEIKKIAEELD